MRLQVRSLKSSCSSDDIVSMQRSHLFLILLAFDAFAVANVLLSVARFFV